MSLKSGISVTPPNLSAVSALRWRNPLSEKKTFIIQSLLAITGGFRERNAHIPNLFHLPFSCLHMKRGLLFEMSQNITINEVAIKFVFKVAMSDVD